MTVKFKGMVAIVVFLWSILGVFTQVAFPQNLLGEIANVDQFTEGVERTDFMPSDILGLQVTATVEIPPMSNALWASFKHVVRISDSNGAWVAQAVEEDLLMPGEFAFLDNNIVDYCVPSVAYTSVYLGSSRLTCIATFPAGALPVSLDWWDGFWTTD